ncbi:glycosyltransferase family 32 protein [Viridothelium virens]|uniref:Glycosyltransferase family 32 protein n=1 Tax=Viridothelium virens TaxID=1048519 RepID=A0A6A6HLG5_VIRVR|nr:glycosyltransferase family 32 protein [Viridothelium virens]
MRRGVLIFLLINVVVIGFLLHSVWTLLTLLVVDGSQDAILAAELPSPKAGKSSNRPDIIPKIIHQTYANDSIPEVWKGAQKSCKELHKDFEYKFWTDKKARDFIYTEYPWFLDTFDSYPYNIQRADVIRYFILAHYGGIYIDLDDGCNRRLDPMLGYPAWVRRTVPTGISNDVMGAVPNHPFFTRTIHELAKYNRNWILPYITVMASTGPLFLSVMWRHYTNSKPPLGEEVKIMFPPESYGHTWSFFTHHKGDSWHQADVQFIFWMGRNWIFLTILGFALAFVLYFVVYSFYLRPSRQAAHKKSSSPRRKFFFWGKSSRGDYERLENRHEV